MKYSKLSILALSAATFISACNSKLDLKPADSLDDNSAITEGNVRILANGMYERAQELEYYGRDFMVVTDVGGNDMKITPSNSNRFIYEFQYMYSPLLSPQTKTWQNAYRVANQASVIIDKLPTTENTAGAKGEAYFMRALAHFDLTRRYTRPYSLNKADADKPNTGVVLVMAAIDDPGNYKPARATLNATYDAIISDLKAAQQTAPDTKPGTAGVFRGSKDAATALLTRAYLYKEDWANVIKEATSLLGGKYPLWDGSNYLANFTSDNATSEDIFALRFLAPENRGSNNFGNIYLPADGSATGGYGDIRLTDGFMNLLEAGDTRKAITQNYAGSNYLIKWIGNGQGLTGMANVKVLRISEVLLNRAEAYAEQGNLSLAVIDVNTLRAKRGLAEFTDEANVKAEIKKERRLELVGEGHGMTDIFRKNDKRSIKDADAILPQTPDITTDNYRIAYPIPQIEIDANANIEQNPGYQKN
ncbi:RagB/SusD family nutrient uptake outer membrane protein [Chitinophaga sp. MM2321]|uniref:RagB/SusD family nutrient uptake outer membrane protein n=1 Tax=Chitinophaga sp. MM2321 TaxID=3137178 RepID=UPI0032D5A3E3